MSVSLAGEVNYENLALPTDLNRSQFVALSQLETQPHIYFNNSEYLRVKPQFNTSIKPKKRKKLLSEKLNTYYQTRERLSRLYSDLGNQKKSDKLHKCSSFFNVLTCGNHIARRVASFHCDNRLCPECANRRGHRLFSEYEPIINAYLAENPNFSVLHLVLTQAQKPAETIKQARQRLIEAIKRLVDRRFWKDSFAGSLNSYEFTISNRTYSSGAIHYHAHLLAFCKLPDVKRNKRWLKEFREAWSSVSKGENKNLKIIPVINLQTGIREVLKYIVKPSDIKKFSTDHLSQIEELRKHRMISTTGEFHKFVKVYRERVKQAQLEPETAQEQLCVGDACPICQEPLHERQMLIKELIIYARNIEQVKGINAVRD
jgi:hypothetical protein